MAYEPFADFPVGLKESRIEAVTLRGGKEREEKAVGVLTFEHEIDAQEGCGEDIEEVREPVGQGGDKIACGRGDGSLGALDDAIDANFVGNGDALDASDDLGDAVGEFVGEGAEVAHDGGEANGEEDREDNADRDDEKKDGCGAGGVSAAVLKLGDASDEGHQNGREESSDVDNQHFFLEGPGEGEQEEDADGEEDVAADGAARLLLLGCEGRHQVGQRDSPVRLGVWMQI